MKHPREGDLVDFPDTRPEHYGKYIHTKFDKGGTHLLVRIDPLSNASWYVDDNFKEHFDLQPVGQQDGKTKWLVKLRKPLPAQTGPRIWTVELFLEGKLAGKYETTAVSEARALANAVVRWCSEKHILPEKNKIYIDLFKDKDAGYTYKITPVER